MSTVNEREARLKLSVALRRGFARRCPRCGRDALFEREKRYRLKPACERCGCKFQAREADTYFFMYMSTGAITGLFLISMFLITPVNQNAGRVVVALFAVVIMFGTLPFRKGMAIAFDVFIEQKFGSK